MALCPKCGSILVQDTYPEPPHVFIKVDAHPPSAVLFRLSVQDLIKIRLIAQAARQMSGNVESVAFIFKRDLVSAVIPSRAFHSVFSFAPADNWNIDDDAEFDHLLNWSCLLHACPDAFYLSVGCGEHVDETPLIGYDEILPYLQTRPAHYDISGRAVE